MNTRTPTLRDTPGLLRCPACRGELVLDPVSPDPTKGTLSCACGRRYPIQDGFPDLRYPDELLPSDEEFKTKYDRGARQYDAGLEWLFRSFSEDETAVRRSMVDLLELTPGARVLEIGCGTGKDSVHIAERIGQEGELWALELSLGMLEMARERVGSSGTRFLLSNASYLPFADRTFDGVFHFGGLNTFGEVPRALAEMARVAKFGAKVVVGDESVPPWLREHIFGRVLMKANPLYRHEVPLAALPIGARSVCVRWVLGSAFYLIDFRVGEGPPPLDLDLPIPGKGDSLRSRYFGTGEG
jgi:ubiquinone/menaquinone biosynthesis C-methylase UbiE